MYGKDKSNHPENQFLPRFWEERIIERIAYTYEHFGCTAYEAYSLTDTVDVMFVIRNLESGRTYMRLVQPNVLKDFGAQFK